MIINVLLMIFTIENRESNFTIEIPCKLFYSKNVFKKKKNTGHESMQERNYYKHIITIYSLVISFDNYLK